MAEYAYQFYQSAVPATQPVPSRQPEQRPRPYVVPKPPKPRRAPVDRRAQERKSNRKIAKLFVVMALAIALFGVFCNSFVARQTSRQNLESARKTLRDYSDANIVLENQLSKLISADKIDRIATQRLGLVKVASGNESFLELEGGNRVLFTQNDPEQTEPNQNDN